MTGPDGADQTATALRKTLNRHGYGFQFATLKRCVDLSSGVHTPQTSWGLKVSEFPVEVGDWSTHVDGILELAGHDFRAFAVLEIKRSHEARPVWAMVAAPYTTGEVPRRRALIDQYRYRTDISNLGKAIGAADIEALAGYLRTDAPVCFYTFELTRPQAASRDERDRVGGNNDTGSDRLSEKAVHQAALSAMGLVHRITAWRNDRQPFYVVPVVVTDASLVTTEADLSAATGPDWQVPELRVDPVHWIWREQHVFTSKLPVVERTIDRQASAQLKTDRLGFSLDHELSKAVAIVNFDQLGEFLNRLENNLTHWKSLG
jgi:hypothetical protein